MKEHELQLALDAFSEDERTRLAAGNGFAQHNISFVNEAARVATRIWHAQEDALSHDEGTRVATRSGLAQHNVSF